MKALNSIAVLGVGISALAAAGCASGPSAPFDVMKNANVTAYRLQNYEPPAQAAPAAAAAQPGALIPGIPAEIQQWAQAALPGLQQLIPPGLLPPGMIPGQPAAATPAPAQQVPRFVDFRILGQSPVLDPKLKEKLGDLFGDSDNYQADHQNCMYPELGLSFSPQDGSARYDMLVSFSCNQVNAVNFAWPHKAAGMSPDMVKKLSEIVPNLFPAGTGWGSAPPPAGPPAGQQPMQQQPMQQQPMQQQPAMGQPMGGQINVNTAQ
ncbi:MAG TPA: hypothetical protein VL137_13555 [Polyangiaceae bacterium]|nr:hypothetical protein [Polyangiaceae bacterium]